MPFISLILNCIKKGEIRGKTSIKDWTKACPHFGFSHLALPFSPPSCLTDWVYEPFFFFFKLRLKRYLEKARKFEVTSGSYIKHQMYINCELWSWKVNPLMPFSVFHCWSLALMASLQLCEWMDFLFSSFHHHTGFPLCAPVNTQPWEKDWREV